MTDDPMHIFSLGLQPNRDKLHQMVIDNFYFFRIPLTYEKRCKKFDALHTGTKKIFWPLEGLWIYIENELWK